MMTFKISWFDIDGSKQHSRVIGSGSVKFVEIVAETLMQHYDSYSYKVEEVVPTIHVKGSDFLRKCLVVAYSTSFDDYAKVFSRATSPIAYFKEAASFTMFVNDFARWYCLLDSDQAGKFIKYVESKK